VSVVKSKLLPDFINYYIFSDMKQNLNKEPETQEDDFPWREALVAVVIMIVLLILAWS
jgi:hypothetical protein